MLPIAKNSNVQCSTALQATRPSSQNTASLQGPLKSSVNFLSSQTQSVQISTSYNIAFCGSGDPMDSIPLPSASVLNLKRFRTTRCRNSFKPADGIVLIGRWIESTDVNSAGNSKLWGSANSGPRSDPWQNAFVERVIGSIRRECLDHIIVLNEESLRRVLLSYIPS
jgi:hypothetical protein